jgi:hypothetical protein
MKQALIILIGAGMTLPGGIAKAAEPPRCDDAKILHTIRTQYEMAELSGSSSRKLTSIVEPREVSLGQPPAAANQYATAETFIALSRYCEGSAQLETGDPDPLYWRIDQAKDGAEESVRVDHCSERHDVFQDKCQRYRPEGPRP